MIDADGTVLNVTDERFWVLRGLNFTWVNEHSFKLGSINQALQHLNEAEIKWLIVRYYSREKIRNVLDEFHLSISAQTIAALFPAIHIDDELCLYCSSPMYRILDNRGCIPWSSRPKCVNCHHIVDKECECKNCTKLIQKKRNEQHDLIMKNYKSLKENPTSENKITLRERLYLGALLSNLLSESGDIIHPVNCIRRGFSPSPKYTEIILQHLYKNKFIIYSPSTAVKNFEIYDQDIKLKDYLEATWELNIDPIRMRPTYFDPLIQELINPTNIDILKNAKECISLWKEVSVFECLEILENDFEHLHLPSLQLGRRIYQSLNYALHSCSMAEVSSILGVATRKFRDRSPIHEIELFPEIIEKCVEEFHANPWEAEDNERIFTLTSVSKFLYQKLLTINEDQVFHLKLQEKSLATMSKQK